MSAPLVPRDEVPHILKHNASNAPPRRILFVDTEAYPVEEENEIRYLFYLACCEYIDTANTQNPERRRVEARTFYNQKEFWDWLERKAQQKAVLTVYGHNIGFDLAVLDYENHLQRLGYQLESFYADNGNQILEVKKERKKIRLLSSSNYAKVPLAELGELLGIEKKRIPSYAPKCIRAVKVDDEYRLDIDYNSPEFKEIVEYCKTDVRILREFILSWIAFIKENDLGYHSATLSGQAFNAYRHRFMKTPIYIHCNPRYDEIELSAYKGGRVECWRIGRYTNDTYYKLDINSMYPYIMRSCKLPYKLTGYCNSLKLEDYIKIRGKRLVIAQCKVKTDKPCVGKRLEDKLVFPVGEFTETLTSPEIDVLLEEGAEVELGETLTYLGDVLFRDYVDYFYKKRKEYKREGNFIYERICKLMLNSLYGKFGQKGAIYDVLDVDKVDPWEYETIYTKDGEPLKPVVKILGKHYIQVGKTVSRDSFIAISAFVTAYARCLMWKFLKTAGPGNCFYCDTDSLFVNSQGYHNLLPYIDQEKLGCLKLEGQTEELVLRGSKHYQFGDTFKLKGIRKSAVKLEEDIYQQEQWPSFKSVIKNQLSGDYRVKRIIKHVNTPYQKGIVLEDGTVRPLLLTL